MKDDVISRTAAINELERGKDKKAKGAVGGFYNQIIDNDIEKLRRLPSAQPTLYGYDIKHLAFVASIIAKKGVSPEEAAAIFRDVNRVIEMVLEDMKKMQENALKQALKKPREGR